MTEKAPSQYTQEQLDRNQGLIKVTKGISDFVNKVNFDPDFDVY